MLYFFPYMRHLGGVCFLSLFIVDTATAQDGEKVSITRSPSVVTSDIATTTVDFSSALQIAASVAPEIALNNFSNPVPIPTDAPEYEQVRLIAALFPPRQQSVGEPDLNAFTEIQATSNSSNQVHKRQGAMRVMVVGDSMTHCHEGDFTWRYRIWDWFRSQNVAVDMVGPYLGTQEPDTPVSTLFAKRNCSLYCLSTVYHDRDLCIHNRLLVALIVHLLGSASCTTFVWVGNA